MSLERRTLNHSPTDDSVARALVSLRKHLTTHGDWLITISRSTALLDRLAGDARRNDHRALRIVHHLGWVSEIEWPQGGYAAGFKLSCYTALRIQP
jgi:hypothetical protein